MSKVKSEALQGLSSQVKGKFSITDEAKSGLFRERTNFFVLVLCLLLEISQAAMIIFSSPKLPPQVPLYYSKPWGEAMLAAPRSIWFLPTIAFAFIFLNFIVAVFLHKAEKFVARILVFASGLVSFISFWAVLKIITLLA